MEDRIPCKRYPCIGIIKTLLDAMPQSKDSDIHAAWGANLEGIERYLKYYSISFSERQSFRADVNRHLKELGNCMDTGIWKRIY